MRIFINKNYFIYKSLARGRFMKKLVAYITLGVSILASVAIGVIPTIKSINGDIDYSSSRKYVYKISDRIVDATYANNLTQDSYNVLSDEDKQEVLDDVVETFQDRLQDVQVTDYSISTVGYDTIEVTFKTDSELYDDVADLLTFSWSFMASTYGSETDLMIGDTAETVNANIATDSEAASVDYADYVDLGTSDDSDARFISPGNASVEYSNGYPYVVIDLENPDGFKELYEQAIIGLEDESDSDTDTEVEEDTTTDTTDTSTSEASKTVLDTTKKSSTDDVDTTDTDDDTDDDAEDDTEEEEEETADENKIFILNNWLSNLTLEDFLTNGGSENIQSSRVKNYVLFALDCSSASNLFWDYDASAGDDETYEQIYFGGYELNDSSSESSYYGSSSTDDAIAYRKALIWAAKFNATTYKYEISIINEGGDYSYTAHIDPQIEYINIDRYDNGIPTILISAIISVVILYIFMGLFFGLTGLMGATSISATLLVTLGVFNALTVDFGLGAIIGLIAVCAISIFTVATYYRKIRNEAYLGKTLKKAYLDGSKKGFWYALDFSVVGFIIGLITYLVPSSTTLAIGCCLLIGSVFNFAINGGLLRLLSYLVYTSSYVSKHPKLLAIDKKFIPNLLNEEKPTYFDTFKAKTSKTSKRVYSIVGVLLLLASVVGIITFQALNGNIYAEDTSAQTTIYSTQLVVTNPTTTTENEVENSLLSFKRTLTTIYDEYGNSFFGITYENAEDIEVENYYYEYQSNSATYYIYFYNLDLGGLYDVDDTSITYTYTFGNNEYEDNSILNVLNILSENILFGDSTSTGELKNSYEVSNSTAGLYTLITVSIALGVVAVYFTIRFGLARALVSILMVGGTVLISVGIFSLMRVAVNPAVTYGAILVAVVLYVIINTFFIAEKEALNENNKKELLANRQLRYDTYEWALNVAGSHSFMDLIVVMFPVISLFFASGVQSIMVLMVLIGSVVGFMFIKVLQLPYEFKVEDSELALRNSFKPVKKERRRLSIDFEGPTESIYPGIND